MTQYDAYLPYGELLVDEHSSSEEMPYKFNGKELDEETGLYYYGARYMNPVTSMWYGVDPLCEKYYSVSPYNYCMNNPIMLVDPDGCKPDSLEAAIMSGMAYQDKDYNYYAELLSGTNWNQIYKSNSRTGFKSALFQRKKEDGSFEYCIAFAGTDNENMKDLALDVITDGLNFFDIPTFQHAQAIGAGLGFSSVGNDEITFTGHSLGGGLADTASKATGNDAIIFNSASVGLITKGIASLFGIGKKGDMSRIIEVYRILSIMFKTTH